MGEKSFIEYYKQLASKKVDNNAEIWNYSIIHFENFLSGNELFFKDIITTLIEDYR